MKAPFAKRLDCVFNVAKISKTTFCEKTHFPYRTLVDWMMFTEDRLPFAHSLGRLCASLLEIGVVCDVEWLLSGKGEEPYLLSESLYGAHLHGVELPSLLNIRRNHQHEPKSVITFQCLHKMISVFTKNSTPHAIYQVRDRMTPYINPGTYILINTEPTLHGSLGFVAVKLKDSKTYLRIGVSQECHFMYVNKMGTPLPQEEITDVYPVTWMSIS